MWHSFEEPYHEIDDVNVNGYYQNTGLQSKTTILERRAKTGPATHRTFMVKIRIKNEKLIKIKLLEGNLYILGISLVAYYFKYSLYMENIGLRAI